LFAYFGFPALFYYFFRLGFDGVVGDYTLHVL